MTTDLEGTMWFYRFLLTHHVGLSVTEAREDIACMGHVECDFSECDLPAPVQASIAAWVEHPTVGPVLRGLLIPQKPA